MLDFTMTATRQIIPGPVGQLECLTLAPEKAKKAVAVICHPHPLYQGTMNNKVVFTIAKAFDDCGMKTVRFNYRGVGQSEGEYADGMGETDDCLAVVEAVKKALPDHRLYLAGFSFGTFVAANACNQLPETQALVTVAPSMENFNFNDFNITCPWLIVQGTEDEIVSAEAVYAYCKQHSEVTLVKKTGVGHFFHGHLTALRQDIVDFMGW